MASSFSVGLPNKTKHASKRPSQTHFNGYHIFNTIASFFFEQLFLLFRFRKIILQRCIENRKIVVRGEVPRGETHRSKGKRANVPMSMR